MINTSTEYALLLQGKVIEAALTFWNNYTYGWLITIFFVIFEALVYFKTQNNMLAFTVGAVFLTLFMGGGLLLNFNNGFMIATLAIQMSGIIYTAFMKTG